MPLADPITFPASIEAPTQQCSSTLSSADATLTSSIATQSLTPPFSLSPDHSSAASLDGNVDDSNNSLQFMPFLDLPSLSASTPTIATTTTASSVAMASSAPANTATTGGDVVAGLTLTGSGIYKQTGPGGARVKRASPTDVGDENDNDPDLLLKRQRNSLAARKYRQKKLDRISELEIEVGQLQGERDALRIQLARQEVETATLRNLLMARERDRDDGPSTKRRRRR
ncbi:hypothetical protein SEPCBS57363_005073 [Sporothrix epigloea]|uniref:BZIP domain-containing protein n=1 Tax=Sporothrix epigloea TaxID=1892477 RepID=A0ABP0DXQ1_9PEZI